MTPPIPDEQNHRQTGGQTCGDGGPAEAAHYIKSAVQDLSLMARRHRHDTLAYLLDMAHLESEEILRRHRGCEPSGG